MFNKRITSVIIILTVFILGSCAGIQFNDSNNAYKTLPMSFQNRSIWHDPSVVKYKLQGLQGYIIEKKVGEDHFNRIYQILPDDFDFTPELIKDADYYHSLVDSRFVTEGSGRFPILEIAASLSHQQMMELTIIDKAILYVDDKDIPWGKLMNFVSSNPLEDNVTRYWVQAVMTTQVLSKTASKVESDAQVSGSAYQVNGQIYNAAETQDRNTIITMLLVDIENSYVYLKEYIADEILRDDNNALTSGSSPDIDYIELFENYKNEMGDFENPLIRSRIVNSFDDSIF